MLWTDGNWITTADMVSLDNEVLAVSSAESITLDQTIRRAIEEAGDALLKHMLAYGGTPWGNGSVSGGHYAAVMNTGIPQAMRARVMLSQIVVSSPYGPGVWSPLKRWAVYWALMLFYRDAAMATTNGRYAGKAELYQRLLHSQYWEAVRAQGLPVVRTPMPSPGALYEPETGVWGSDNVSLVNGPGTVADDYDVAIAWIDDGNVQSQPAAPVTVELIAGKVVSFDIASLTAPTGVVPAALRSQGALLGYGLAVGWHVYVGLTGGTMYRQTATPLPMAQTTYTLAGDPVAGTAQAGQGQFADHYIAFTRWNQRG